MNHTGTVQDTQAVERLVQDVRKLTTRRLPPLATAEAVAESLEPVLHEPGLLTPEQEQGCPDEYRQHVLHVEPDGSFSLVALVWLPGQSTCIHDHVSWCTVGVYRGQETETQYAVTRPSGVPHLRPVLHRVNPQGSTSGIAPPGDIHQVANGCATTAISLHVYGADIGRLGSSIRRRYDLPVLDAPEG